MTAAGPPPQADAVDKVIKNNGWKNILGLADVLTIDQETLDVAGEERLHQWLQVHQDAGHVRPGHDRLPAHPQQDDGADQDAETGCHHSLREPARVPGALQGSAGAQRDVAHPRRHGLRSSGHLRHGSPGGRGCVHHGLRRQRQPAGAAGQLADQAHAGRLCPGLSGQVQRGSRLLRRRRSRPGDRPRRRYEAGRRRGRQSQSAASAHQPHEPADPRGRDDLHSRCHLHGYPRLHGGVAASRMLSSSW